MAFFYIVVRVVIEKNLIGYGYELLAPELLFDAPLLKRN